MKRYKLSTLLKLCLIVLSCIAIITACEKQDKVDTDQLGGGEVVLRSFGPCPIQRGAELRIIGANMDKVVSVSLPGCGAITDIKRISPTEIRVIIPQNAEPGVITLKAGNKEITSITSLVFDEPIIISSITPLTVKAGATIKIEGDYLNLIEEIIFTDDVHVLKADFVSQSREAIELKVPEKAQSGKIIVSNGADIIPDAAGNVGIPLWIYSDDELNVVLPAITKISPNPIKVGNVLTMEGTDFDLVDSLVFAGNVGTRTFVSKTETKIEVKVPANANAGAVKLIAFSGLAVPSDSLALVAPVITSVSPDPVKNGETLTIKGTDLDLVSTVVFGGDKAGTIVDGGTATQIQVTVPKDAKDGVTLNTLSGQAVQLATLKMVVPTVTAYAPTSVPAGSDVVLTGTDLDLVVSVTFPNGLVVPVTPSKATELTVTVPTTAVSGAVVLTLTNGNTVNCPAMDIVSPVFAFLPTPPAADAEIHAGEILAVDVANGSKLTDVQVNGASTKFILNDTKLYILIPNRAAGKCELKLISSNGTVSYTIPVIGAGTIETVIYEGPWTLSWGDGPAIPKSFFQDVPAGSTLRVYLQVTDPVSADLAFNDANWAKIQTGHPDSKPDGTIAVAAGTTTLDITLTADVLHWMLTTSASWDSETAIRPVGAGAIIAKISVITKGAPQETVLWSGSIDIGWDSSGLVPVDVSLLAPGQTLGVDFVAGASAAMRVATGSWWIDFENWPVINGGNDQPDIAPSQTNVEFSITQTDIDNIKMQDSSNPSILVAGQGITIKRIYVK